MLTARQRIRAALVGVAVMTAGAAPANPAPHPST
jgi:hypothetical protein